MTQSVQSVSKALDLLCCFSADRPEWGVTEVADYLGLCKSAAHRILATCEQYHFVTRTPQRRYRLGNRALELGNTYRLNRQLLRKAEPILLSLAEDTRSTARLAELDGKDIFELGQSAGVNFAWHRLAPRFRIAAHATALGKVLLAFGGEQMVEDFVGLYQNLKRYTPFTIATPGKLKAELKLVLERGYAISNQECFINCCCIAVPVKDRSQKTIAALSVSCTPERLGGNELDEMLHALSKAVKNIGSEQIGSMRTPTRQSQNSALASASAAFRAPA